MPYHPPKMSPELASFDQKTVTVTYEDGEEVPGHIKISSSVHYANFYFIPDDRDRNQVSLGTWKTEFKLPNHLCIQGGTLTTNDQSRMELLIAQGFVGPVEYWASVDGSDRPLCPAIMQGE